MGDIDASELGELTDALQEVWSRSGQLEDDLRQSAEADAKAAELALMQELDAEEAGKGKTQKRREKKHQKDRQRRKDKGNAAGGQEVEPTTSVDDKGPTDGQKDGKVSA